MSAQRVVVTGATGHLGINLTRALVARGVAVRVLVHREARILDGLDIEQCQGDVCEPESLRQAFAGADVVFHLAGKISITGDQGGEVTRTNVEGAANAAQAALACGVRRFVHTCSIHAFAQTPLDEVLDEERQRALSPAFPAYDRSKAGGETAVRAAIASGLDAVIVHPTAVIGPADYRPSRMGRVLLDLYHRRLPTLVPGGFNWVDVRDVALGMLAAAERGRKNESYLLGGHWHSVVELARMAESATGVPPPRFTSPMWLARLGAPFIEAYGAVRGVEPLYTAESLTALESNRSVSSEKAARELGYRARPTATTVRDTYAFFDGAGMLRPALSADRRRAIEAVTAE